MKARPRSLSAFVSGPLAVAMLLVAPTAGCPGELSDPSAFAGLPPCPGNIDVQQLFLTKCGSSICHAGDNPAAGLDLVSPGVEGQLVSEPSEECEGYLRVHPTRPDESFLLAKITDPPSGCGNRMPLVGSLSPDEVACVRAYVHEIARAQAGDGGP